jgi:hypothetical protein
MSQSARSWVLANAVGVTLAMATFGIVADNPAMPEGSVPSAAGHLLGFLAFAAVLAAFQRRALQPVRTRFRTWVLAQGVSVWLVYGLAYELIGPPADFALGLVALGVTTGLLLRAEARATGAPSRRLPLVGAAAGLGAVVGMAPVILLAEPIDDAMGGGMAPFLVIIALIGAVGGTSLGTILRPGVRTRPLA